MAEAILLRTLPETLGEVYVWKKYEVVENISYKWNRWNVVSSTIYKWNKWNVETVATPVIVTDNQTIIVPGDAYLYSSYQYPNGGFIGSGSYRLVDENKAGWYYIVTITSMFHLKEYISGSYKYNATRWTMGETESKGSVSYGQVTSTSSSTYPSNGVSGSYWYESAGSSTSYSKGSTQYSDYSQGSYIGDKLSTNRNEYPDNGKSGSYWYVFDGEA